MTLRLVIFDFDGTLADTAPLLRSLIAQHLDIFPAWRRKGIRAALTRSSFDQILVRTGVEEKLFPYILKHRALDIPTIAPRIRLNSRLSQLARIPLPKIIVSNTSSALVRAVLARRSIQFFQAIYGSESFDHKSDKFKQLFREYKLRPSEVMYVGDRPLDVTLARRVGCSVILLMSAASWSTPHTLLASNPDGVVSSLGDVPRMIQYLQQQTTAYAR